MLKKVLLDVLMLVGFLVWCAGVMILLWTVHEYGSLVVDLARAVSMPVAGLILVVVGAFAMLISYRCP